MTSRSQTHQPNDDSIGGSSAVDVELDWSPEFDLCEEDRRPIEGILLGSALGIVFLMIAFAIWRLVAVL